jgi:hypothetical protein
MASLSKMRKRVAQISRAFIDETIKDAIIAEKETIIDLNTNKQLYGKGIDSKGDKIAPPYARTTVSMKKRLNLPSDRVTLFQSGAFYDATDIDATNQEATIINRDDKFPKLAEKYGDNIFGLTPENKLFLAEVILKPILTEKIKSILL